MGSLANAPCLQEESALAERSAENPFCRVNTAGRDHDCEGNHACHKGNESAHDYGAGQERECVLPILNLFSLSVRHETMIQSWNLTIKSRLCATPSSRWFSGDIDPLLKVQARPNRGVLGTGWRVLRIGLASPHSTCRLTGRFHHFSPERLTGPTRARS